MNPNRPTIPLFPNPPGPPLPVSSTGTRSHRPRRNSDESYVLGSSDSDFPPIRIRIDTPDRDPLKSDGNHPQAASKVSRPRQSPGVRRSLHQRHRHTTHPSSSTGSGLGRKNRVNTTMTAKVIFKFIFKIYLLLIYD